MLTSTAIAHPNIALIKYWGKRDRRLNLPAAGSVSLTLGPVRTRTTVTWEAQQDSLLLNGIVANKRATKRISNVLDLLRKRAPMLGGATVISDNNFPTASGLASSASGFAALVVAAANAAKIPLSKRELSVLARRGSGSAARSLCGGFALMYPGSLNDGTDAWATPIANSNWPLSVIIAVTNEGEKKIASTDGMNQTEQTSPYFDAWVKAVPIAINEALTAIKNRDFERLALVSETSALQMHASAIAASPGVLYWKGVTIDVIHQVRAWRKAGIPAFFTVDAGPHVKVFTLPEYAQIITQKLEAIPGVLRTIFTIPARSAYVIRTKSDS